MKKYGRKTSKKSNSSKNKNYHSYLSQSKSSSRAPSKKVSKTNLLFPSLFNHAKIKLIIKIQRYWKNFFKKNIEKKIIKIQSVYRGFNIRKIFNDVLVLNKKLECFFFIIKVTMFRHAINFDYIANRRIDYYSDHKKSKQFLLLQRRIRYFLFMKKVNILSQLGLFNDIYIITFEYRTKIKSKATADKYFSKPIYKYHRPLSKIIKIQKNYRLHVKYIKKLPKHDIDKKSLNKCPLITKERREIKIDINEIYKNVKMRVANQNKDFHDKLYYNYKPLLLIQRKYKERYKYLKENYLLRKHKKYRKTVINKHHYIYHARVVNAMDKVLLIQKNIKYFLYRRHSMVNLIPKIVLPKCEMNKSYGFREEINKYFYEEFVRRLIIIIRKFFLSLYIRTMKSNSKFIKNSSNNSFLNSSILNSPRAEKRNSYRDTSNLHFVPGIRNYSRKETFSLSPHKGKGSPMKIRSNFANNDSKDKGKKKVSFKNDFKRSESKKFTHKIGSDLDSIGRLIKKKDQASSNFIRKKQNFGTIRGLLLSKK